MLYFSEIFRSPGITFGNKSVSFRPSENYVSLSCDTQVLSFHALFLLLYLPLLSLCIYPFSCNSPFFSFLILFIQIFPIFSFPCFIFSPQFTSAETDIFSRIFSNFYRPDPEFVNIQWRLNSRLFEETCLFKGQSVQQGFQWLQLFVLLLKAVFCKQLRKH